MGTETAQHLESGKRATGVDIIDKKSFACFGALLCCRK
jgi:hypothetical protein